MTFDELDLVEPLLRAVSAQGYTEPTPIQARGIPPVLAGRDLCGVAQTGTGKTAAFALPILQRLMARSAPVDRGRLSASSQRPIRALVLSPTRELAAQIGESFAAYGRHAELRHAVIFGGVGQDAQTRALRAGLDILVATPGRLLDLMGQQLVKLEQLEVFVLDEADRMLDMGFIHDVRRVIAALPRRRQTLFFSATMPQEIEELSASILSDPVRVEVTPSATTVDTVTQRLYFVEKGDKRPLLQWLLSDGAITRALVFTRTKHGANRVVEQLAKGRPPVRAEAIHGNKSQNARERALSNFKRGATRVLVASDLAARGIDIEGISHVINYDLPNVPESYVHRIGRTARAGASGIALSFCDRDEREFVVEIERLIRQHIPVVAEHPHRSPHPSPAPTELHRGAAERRREAAPVEPRPGRRPQGSAEPREGGGRRRRRPGGWRGTRGPRGAGA
jgi:ATP-dependent RNA helicase RhlE